MDFVNDIFAALESEDSIMFLLSVAFFFLLGFVIAWIAWGSRARRLRRDLEELQGNYSLLQTELEGLKEQLDLKEADLARAEREAEEAVAYAKVLETERDNLHTDLLTVNDLNAKLKTSVATYETNIEDLHHQILGLKTRNKQLLEEAKMEGSGATQLEAMQKAHQATLDRLNGLETKLDSISSENKDLKGELDILKNSTESLVAAASLPTSNDFEDSEEKSPKVLKAAAIAELGAMIPKLDTDEKDDLTLIKGIGKNIESQLNNLGIHAFAQISQFEEETIDKVTTAISFFPGRIKRDDWVGQASRLLAIKKENPAALNPSSVFPSNVNDLKIIEGIGTKIEKLLKEANVSTWSDLANTDVQQLKSILNKAGERFRMHDPSTWPMQAQKAAAGEWEELKEYQDLLMGGRVVEG